MALKLKAGRVGDMGDSLAGDMDAAMIEEWNRIKDIALPNDAEIVKDRQLLFVAIARGLLNYLERRENRIETTEDRANGTGSEHHHELDFEWE